MKANAENKAKVRKKLLTVDEAAGYICVSKNTLYQWASQRRIETVHIGRKLLFRQEYLDELIQRSIKYPTDEIKL